MPALQLPRIGFGTWKLKGADCTKGVLKALEIGYRLIDTAQIYQNEAQVGAAITENTVNRKDFILATKIFIGFSSVPKTVSNFGSKLCDEAIAACPKPILANQIETHPLLQQREMRDYLKQHDMYHVAYSPLARGHIAEVSEVVEIAQKHGVSPNQVSLAWLIHYGTIPIPKASSESHIRDNFGALDLKLNTEDVASIDSIKVEKRFVNPPVIAPRKFK
jgi:2,5-diketo-D-gluconate reductase B